MNILQYFRNTLLHQLCCYVAQMTHYNVNSCYISSLINAKNAIVTLLRIYASVFYTKFLFQQTNPVYGIQQIVNLQNSEETQDCHILMATSFYQCLALPSTYIHKSGIFTVIIKFFLRYPCVCICLICVPVCRHYFAKFSNNT